MMRFAISIGLILTLVLVVPPAQAHKPSDSYLSLSSWEDTIHGQWDIALRDLDYAIGIDNNNDGSVTWGELKTRHKAIASYALSRLQIRASGTNCPINPRDFLVDHHSDGAYAVVLFSVVCPRIVGSLEIGYNLFFDLDPQHRGLLRFQSKDTFQTGIFSPDRSVHQINPTSAAIWGPFFDYVREGVHHILVGYDHILFLLTLLLPAVLLRQRNRWTAICGFREVTIGIFKTVTAFTVAHSITLSLAVIEVIDFPSRYTESAIAASVVVAAFNNLYPIVTQRLWLVAFTFGLVHGLGFANVLTDLGLPDSIRVLSLFGFNLGVEFGQLMIVCLFLPCIYYCRKWRFYPRLVLELGSLVVMTLASIWFVERAFQLSVLPI